VANNRLNLNAESSLPTLGANEGMTFALWVNPQSVSFDGEVRPHFGSNSGPNADFAHLIALGAYGNAPIMSIELDSSLRVHGWVEGDGADTQVEVTGNASLVANQWTHIAITYDRVNNEAKTYINGVLDSTTNIAGVGDGELSFTNARIGGGFSTSDATGSVFMGQLDDVYIFTSVLNEEEIAAVIPEPRTYAMFIAGAALLCFLAHRRRQSR